VREKEREIEEENNLDTYIYTHRMLDEVLFLSRRKL